MSHEKKQLAREEVAKIEVGHTDITRAQKWVLIVAFLVLIFSVPVVQTIYEIRNYRTGRSKRGTPLPQWCNIFPSVPKALQMVTHAKSPTEPKMEVSKQDSLIRRVFKANSVLLHDINRFEDALADESLLTQKLVPPAQNFLTGVLDAGNEEAYPGRDKWLLYRPGIDYLIGPGFLDRKWLIARAQSGSEWKNAPQPDPLIAIFQFQKQLVQRGIQLIIIPTPTKPVVHPEKFSARYEGYDRPLQNYSYARFKHELENPEEFFKRYEEFLAPYRRAPVEKARKLWYWQFIEALDELRAAKDLIVKNRVLLFDAAPELVQEKVQAGEPQYLETDTHWRPETIQIVAKRLKAFIEKNVKLPPAVGAGYKREPKKVSNLGDVAVMMKLPGDQTLFAEQDVTVQQIINGTRLWRSDTKADVLLLGDSFSNVCSLGHMGWGEAAGLVEQLSFELQRLVDAMIRNDNGAHSTREMLSRELARGNDRLAGKKVVIWQFAVREFAVGDWRVKQTSMKLSKPRDSLFLEIREGDSRIVSGVIQEISAAPRPGSVPYEDHIINAHLTDLKGEDGQPLECDALVAMYSMRKNVWTRAARYRVGQTIRIRLRNYDEINRQYKVENINSAELSSDVMFEMPCWGQELHIRGSTVTEVAQPVRDIHCGIAEMLGILAVLAVVVGVVRIAENRENGGIQ